MKHRAKFLDAGRSRVSAAKATELHPATYSATEAKPTGEA